MDNAIKYVTCGVLAGAYLRADNRKAFLTHVVEVHPDTENPGYFDWSKSRVLCNRVKLEHVNDDSCAPGYSETAPATCPVCAKRDPR